MPFKIVRNDITRMETEAIVNTANEEPTVGTGCDTAIYQAAGYERLLAYRREHIGRVPEGEVFITPAFGLKAKVIIHAVSPLYQGGGEREEEKLRSCYRKSLQLAKKNNIRSISFPLIATGGFGYPREEGMRIAVDEINAFLLGNEMDIYLVVFSSGATALGGKLFPGLEEYINQKYVEERLEEEYDRVMMRPAAAARTEESSGLDRSEYRLNIPRRRRPAEPEGANAPGGWRRKIAEAVPGAWRRKPAEDAHAEKDEEPWEDEKAAPPAAKPPAAFGAPPTAEPPTPAFGAAMPSPAMHSYDMEEELADVSEEEFLEIHESRLAERIRHASDTFSQYLLYLIREKNMENAEVYKRAIVDKKIFSKIKNNVNYHPQKLTALCLCMGARLNLDESRDLLARAGYALSPCDKTDIIFSYFIENQIYDMIELDIQLEEHGLPCIIQ